MTGMVALGAASALGPRSEISWVRLDRMSGRLGYGLNGQRVSRFLLTLGGCVDNHGMSSFFAVAATSLASLLSGLFGGGQPQQAPVPETPVPARAIVASPATGIKGTVILIHGGGWQGPGATAQQGLMDLPGQMLVRQGWRVLSLDYHSGKEGLRDVLDAANAELATPTGGLLCLYGESAGGHLALLAAAKLPAIDCVIAAGAPTDLLEYRAEAASSDDQWRDMISNQIRTVFGTTEQQLAPWEPVRVAQSISADVLLLRQDDDRLVLQEQLDGFLDAMPTAQSVNLESSVHVEPSTWWMHGTLSDKGRREYHATLTRFVARAVAAHRAEVRARRTGCAGVVRHVGAGDAAVLTPRLECLARADATVSRRAARRARTTTISLHGAVNAARAWSALRATAKGRRVLAALAGGRARTTLQQGDPSRITIRVR